MIESRLFIELWEFFKAHTDKKQIDVLAEKYIDIMADHGIEDEVLQESLNSDDDLDRAIQYYLDLDNSDEDY